MEILLAQEAFSPEDGCNTSARPGGDAGHTSQPWTPIAATWLAICTFVAESDSLACATREDRRAARPGTCSRSPFCRGSAAINPGWKPPLA